MKPSRSKAGAEALLVAAVVGAVGLWGAPGRAQNAATAAAEELFREGRQLYQEGKLAQACPMLAESLRLDRAGGTAMALALCHEKANNTASAWLAFQDALDVARKEKHAVRIQVATEHITALEKRLRRIRIVVPAAARVPGLVVSRDGQDLGKETWEVAIPADPGSHLIRATASAFDGWSREVEAPAEGEVIEVSVPRLAPLTPPASSAPLAASAAPSSSAPAAVSVPPPASAPASASLAASTLPKPPPGDGRRYLAGTMLGAGALSLGIGTVFGLLAVKNASRARGRCSQDPCFDDQARQENQSARTQADVATVSLSLGAVLVGVGAYFWVIPGRHEASLGVAARF